MLKLLLATGSQSEEEEEGELTYPHEQVPFPYRGTSLIRNIGHLGPYSRTMPRALWHFWGGGQFFMSEVPL